jgi:hypothetical protein
MEYLEFFFGNFWHWLGGLFYLAVIFSTPLLYIGRSDKKEGGTEK